MSERESEIAAKIEMLRRQQKLASQKKARKPEGDDGSTEDGDGGEKNEGFFLSMIEEGEALFGTAPTAPTLPTTATEPNAPSEDDRDKGDGNDSNSNSNQPKASAYKPKVSTWGMFPRPKNISRAYGGGKKIPAGGVSTREESLSEESRLENARVRAKLAKYRGGTTKEAALELEHADEIKQALSQAEGLMRRARESEATRILKSVLDYTSTKSRVGGEVRLALALALEGSGRRSEARNIYGTLLRENRFNEIRQKVKRLNSGFADMEKMKVTAADISSSNSSNLLGDQIGVRSADFTIPDISSYIDKRVVKRYREEVIEMTPEEKRAEAFLIACVFGALLGIPALVLLFAKFSSVTSVS